MAETVCVLQDFLRMGGTERNSLALCRKLRSEGHKVVLVTARPGGPLGQVAQFSDYLWQVVQPFDMRLNWFPDSTLQHLDMAKCDRAILMGRAANEFGFKIKKILPSIELIASIRTGRVLTTAYVKTLRTADAVWVNSEYAGQRALAAGVDALKIKLVKNFEIHALSPNERDKQRQAARQQLGIRDTSTRVFVKVAAFRPGKRHENLLHAFAEFAQKNPELDWRLLLVGTGPREKQCQRLAQRLHIADRVVFCGLQLELARYYYAADAALSVSEEESNSNFIQEAQRAGLPFIAIRSGGTAENPSTQGKWVKDLPSFKKQLAVRWQIRP